MRSLALLKIFSKIICSSFWGDEKKILALIVPKILILDINEYSFLWKDIDLITGIALAHESNA